MTAETVAISSITANYRRPMAVVTTLFFMWGFLTSLNDILIPHLKAIFSLNYAQAMLVQFSFFSAYLLFSIPAGKVVDWLGFQRAMAAGLGCMAVGAVLFLPAANMLSFPMFLGALMILAGGITILQVSANPYVVALGPASMASSRLNLTQGFNSLGHTIAPYIGGLLILGASGAAIHGDSSGVVPDASTVKLPYLVLALTLAALAVLISTATLPRVIPQPTATEKQGSAAALLSHRNLVLGVICIFLYVGAEVSIGSFLVNYLSQDFIGNMPARDAAKYVSVYWGAAMVGRFIGSALLRKYSTQRLLSSAAAIAFVLVMISLSTRGNVAMWSIVTVGLFNSVMFPSIFTLAVADLGPLTSRASGLLITAIVGGAILPVLQGLAADRAGIQMSFLIPAVCYLYIIYFALQAMRPSEVRALHIERS